MDSFKEKFLRTPRTWTDILPITYLAAFALLFVGAVLASATGSSNLAKLFTPDTDVQAFMNNYIAFIGTWIVIPAAILIPKPNRPMIRQIFPKKISKVLIGIVIGGVAGFLLNSINVVGAVLLGDLKLHFNKIEVLTIIGFILFVGIQSGAEEILSRLYIYQKLRRRYKDPFVAVAGNALFFVAMHLGNDGLNAASVLELLGWGVLFALIVLYFDNLWISIALHTSWNFTQNIFYGLPNSGLVSKYSIFKLDAAADDFFFDTGFGVEGSWGAVLVLVIICAVLIIKYKDHEKNDIWKQGDWKQDR